MKLHLTNAELAILSLIVERSCHGYDIEAVIKVRGMRNWTEIGFSSIYRILSGLEEAALISSEREPAPGRGPARRVYTATREGRVRHAEESLSALSTPHRSYPLFLQGLAALPALDPNAVVRAISDYREGLKLRLSEIEALASPDLPGHVAAMFSYSETLLRAEMKWIEDFELELRAGGSP